MVYTTEEKRKMDSVLAAFADYTAASKEFDIAYSDKTGYVRLIIEECADHVFFPLQSFEKLVEMFCMEFIFAEVNEMFSGGKYPENMEVDYDRVRFRIQRYIDVMDEDYREQAENAVNRYIINCVRNRLFS